jgi:hypothetical protein
MNTITKHINIKSLIIGLLFGASLFATYHYSYNKGYKEGYRNGDTQTFNCTDGSKIVYSKDELLHYKTELLNAYNDALHWYYIGNKQEWYEVFMKTKEYQHLDSCLIDGWEDFYCD